MFRDLRGKNLVREHYEVAMRFLRSRVSNQSGIFGVVILGGIARGYSDKLSDIDIIVFTDKFSNVKIPKGEISFKGCTIDIDVFFLDDEFKEAWSHEKRWAFSQVVIVHDPWGWIKKLLDSKLVFNDEERREILIENSVQFDWYCPETIYKESNSVAYQWVYRGDLISAHFAINTAIHHLFKVLFAINREFIPPEKWMLYCAYHLSWLPRGFKKCIQEAILIREFTLEELERRIKALRRLWKEILPRVEKEVGMPFSSFAKWV